MEKTILTCNLGHKYFEEKEKKLVIENLNAQIEFFKHLSVDVALLKQSSVLYVPQLIIPKNKIKKSLGKKNCYFQESSNLLNNVGLQSIGKNTIYFSKETLDKDVKFIYSFEHGYVTFNVDFSSLSEQEIITQLEKLLSIATTEFNKGRPSIIGASFSQSIDKFSNDFFNTIESSLFEIIIPSNTNTCSHELFIISPLFNVLECKSLFPENHKFFNHSMTDRPAIIRVKNNVTTSN